jgi:hypothetical protein
MFVLLVTWLAYQQPPSSYQTTFSDQASCEASRDQLIAEGKRLLKECQAARVQTVVPCVTVPKVVALCSKQ